MTDVSSMVKKPVPGWVTWPIVGLAILFAAGGLVINRADAVAFILLGLTGIALVLTRRVGLSLPLRLIGWASAAILFVAVISYRFGIQTDIGVREVGRYVRFVGFAPLTAIFLVLDGRQRRWIWISVPLGGVLAGVVAVFQSFGSAHLTRASGQSFPILFGDLALATAFLSAMAYLSIKRQFPRIALPVCLLGFLGSITASFLSGARGSWLAVPVLAFLLIWFYRRQSGLRKSAVVFSILFLVVLVGVGLPSDQVSMRMYRAISNLDKYRVARPALFDPKAHLGCLTGHKELESIAAMMSPRNTGKADIEVIAVHKKPLRIEGRICDLEAAIRFKNADPKRYAWVKIDRSLPNTASESSALFLVRGAGWVKLAMKKARRVPFKFSRLNVLSVPPSPPDVDIVFILPPRGEVTLIPVARVAGEYIFAYGDTSVGLRLEMWRAAWGLFLRHPVLGVGTGAFEASAWMLAQDGSIAPTVAQFDHPHNEYFAQLSSRGILGLFSLLTLLGLVGIGSARALASRDREVASAGGCGLIIVAGYAIFGLTETVFTHAMAITYFLFFSAFFLSIVYGPRAPQEEYADVEILDKRISDET